MTYCYPGIGGKPIIIVGVECLLTGLAWHSQMLIDTGADSSCFPAALAERFNHNNSHPKVTLLKNVIRGIGGTSDAYLHGVRIGLIHPSKSNKKAIVLAWQSRLEKIQFVDKFECDHGLIGMDIIREWTDLSFEPLKNGGISIRITV